jgi:hypothetical protein
MHGSAEQSHQETEPQHDHPIEIIINTNPVPVEQRVVDYAEIVKLAFPDQTGRKYNVVYRKAVKPKEGILVAGGPSVEVKKGTIFDVAPTTES